MSNQCCCFVHKSYVEIHYLAHRTYTAVIHDFSHGLVGHRTRENFADFEVPYVIAYYAVDFIKAPKQTNYWRNRILKVAKDYSSDYTFAISNDKIFKGEMNQYGWGYAGEKPVIAAVDKDNRKFKMTAEFSLVLRRGNYQCVQNQISFFLKFTNVSHA